MTCILQTDSDCWMDSRLEGGRVEAGDQAGGNCSDPGEIRETTAEVVRSGPTVDIFCGQRLKDMLMVVSVRSERKKEKSKMTSAFCFDLFGGTGVAEQLKKWIFHVFQGSSYSGLFTQVIHNLHVNPNLQARWQNQEDKQDPACPSALCITRSSTSITLSHNSFLL